MPQIVRRARKRKASSAKTSRFDADLEGRTMTEEQTIEKRAILVLTAREAEAFVDAILKPTGPGPVLLKAAREYLREMGE